MDIASVSKQIPDGISYERKMPNTLDLAERLSLAINALTRAWVPEEHWALAFNVDMSQKPPRLFINHSTDAYLNIPPKFLAALALSREGSGSQFNLDIDTQVIKTQMGLIGNDGLSYSPKGALKSYNEIDPYSEIWAEGRMIHALTILGQTDNAEFFNLAKKKTDRILELTTQKDDYLYLWKGRFKPNQKIPDTITEPKGNVSNGSLLDTYKDPKMSIIYSVGSTGFGAGLLYRATGYEPALELSKGLANWALEKVFNDPDGSWDIYHFHHSLFALMAVCQYAVAADDLEMLKRVNTCYLWAKHMGDQLLGYYTEWMPGSDLYLQCQQGNSVEICEVSDMIVLALYLTKAGIGNYWNDIDRWTRNMLSEGQMINTDFLDDLPKEYFATQPSNRPYDYSDQVMERTKGSFFGWMSANDGIRLNTTGHEAKIPDHSIMHCCTANGALGMYYVFDSVINEKNGRVCINLLLNKSSRWLDIKSFIPFEGKVILDIKDAKEIAIRIPEWSHKNSFNVEGSKAFRINGEYLEISNLCKGQTITVNFILPEQVINRVIGERPYKLTLKGPEVTSIYPKGQVYPLFNKTQKPESTLKQRFVSNKQEIIW